MKSNYFQSCRTLDELQSQYRKLLRELHPDMHAGESPEQLAEWTRLTQLLNAEYAITAAQLRFKHESERARTTGKPAPSMDDEMKWADADERIRQAIEKIVFLPDLEIELCGFWVWVGGMTKPVKEQLKAANYRWSPKKKCGISLGFRHHHAADIPLTTSAIVTAVQKSKARSANAFTHNSKMGGAHPTRAERIRK